MKRHNLTRHLTILIFLFYAGITQAGVSEEVGKLQKRWAEVNYTLKGDEQKHAFETLISKAEKITTANPDAAEAWIWNGIIKSSYAGAKGGLGALGLVKDSRVALEKALSLNPEAMQGSAYTSLGALYFKVPGWPIAFGDDDKAEKLLKQGLALNPDGIDSNFFYAEFLAENGKYVEARSYLLKAQQAAPRPTRPLADKGRHEEISRLLGEIQKKQLASAGDGME